MKFFVLSILLFGSFSIQAQYNQKIDYTLSVVSYTHNYQCNNDVNGPLPEPRFILDYRDNVNLPYLSHIFTLGNEIACGTVNYTGFSTSRLGSCNNEIYLKLVSWEEDGFGTPYSYDNGDQNLGAFTSIPYTIRITDFPNNATIPVTLTNGYSVTFNLTWNYSALAPSTMLSGSSVCRNQANSVALLPNQSDIVNFRWYADTTSIGRGNNAFAVGTSASIPSSLYPQFGNTMTFYVAGLLGANCETRLQKMSFIINQVPDAPITDSVFYICYGTKASVPVSNHLPNAPIMGYSDNLLTNSIGSTTTNAAFETDNLISTTPIYLIQQNAQGCKSLPSTKARIVVNPRIEPASAQDVTYCFGENYRILASQTTIPTTFVWKDAQRNQLATNNSSTGFGTYQAPSNLVAGTYTYFVQNRTELLPTGSNRFCLSSDVPVRLTIIPRPQTPTNVIATTTCPGETVTMTFNPSSPAQVFWYADSLSIGSMASGSRFVTPPLFNTDTFFVTQKIGACESLRKGVLARVIPLPAPVAIIDTICQNERAQIGLIAVATADQYLWYPTSTGINSIANGRIYNTDPLTSSKTYFAEYKVGRCVSPRVPVSVRVNALPIVTNARTNTPICDYDTLRLAVDSVPGCSYYWVGVNGYKSTLRTPFIARATEANQEGAYTIILTNRVTGCVSLPTEIIANIRKKPDNIVALNDGPKCESLDIQFDATALLNARYSWTGPSGFTSNLKSPKLANVYQTPNQGTYKLVVEIEGCKSDTIYNYLEIYKKPIANAGPDVTITESEAVQLSASGGTVFNWDATPFLDYFDVNNPTAATLPKGQHDFSLILYDEKGCSDRDTLTVTVKPRTILNIRDLFTPNQDNKNDNWEIQYIENVTNYNIRVFSRSGEIVFQSTDYTQNWDGTVAGKLAPAGTYWFVIQTPQKEYKGSLTILY